MIQIQGIYFPQDVGFKYRHSFQHVRSLEWAIAHCPRRRTALQAGGNIGLWPRRLAQVFDRVYTFEPDAQSRACLVRNVPPSVHVRAEALGDELGVCGLARQSLGSHCVIRGDEIPVITIDSLALSTLDFLQLDIEGYEWHALMGARETIARCRPMIQLELRNFTEQYGQSDDEVRRVLDTLGYRELSAQPGNDVVFGVAA